MLPTKINIDKDNNELNISWNDGSDGVIKLANLRNLCPCAVCASEKEGQSESYIPIYTKDQLTVTNIDIIGQYAISISWEDGHNTGIHEFSQLKSIEV